jgi:hypothetical protein
MGSPHGKISSSAFFRCGNKKGLTVADRPVRAGSGWCGLFAIRRRCIE